MKLINVLFKKLKERKKRVENVLIIYMIILGVILLISAGVKSINAIVFGFILFSLYFGFLYTIKIENYTKDQIKNLGPKGIKARMRVEEIELVAKFGGFFFLAFILLTSFPQIVIDPKQDIAKVPNLIILYAIFLGFMLMHKWIGQNERNLIKLGDRLDELEKIEQSNDHHK